MDQESAIGQSFGNYRVVRVLGRGGMGVVYLAEHTLLGRQAVVKQLLPELSADQDNLQRFFNEARAATMIKHPGIVDVFDFGQHPMLGSAFIVMEFLDGESLASRIERERILPIDLATYVTRQIASPLGAAHAVGIVHRDLKPDNVYLARDPDAPHEIRVKVLDFGIAKLAGQMSAGGVKTRTGAVLGTPRYMSPEQCHGAAQLDHRADIYSLGCIFFEMLCGRPPFTGQGLGEVLGAHMYQAPPRPSTIASVPAAVDDLVVAMLAKKPEERPQTVEAVIAALDQFRRSAQGPAVVPSASGSMPAAPLAPPALAPPALAPPALAPPALAPPAPTGEAATVVPVAVTTLGSVAGAVAPPRPMTRRPRSLRWIIPAVLAVAALGAVAMVLAQRADDGHPAAEGKGSASAGDAAPGSGSQVAIPPAPSGSAAVPTSGIQDIDSKAILGRAKTSDEVFAKWVVVPWKELDSSYGGRLSAAAKARSNADAAAIATALAARLTNATPDQIDAIAKQQWDLPGPPRTEALDVTPGLQLTDEVKQLALRLHVGEAGIVHASLGYFVVVRVAAPSLDPLESADVLARPAAQGTVYAQHVLIGWKDTAAEVRGRGTPAGMTRTKADADKLAQDVLAQAKGGADFTALMKTYSEDPGSKDTGQPYEVNAQSPLVPQFKKLALRLEIGEVGMVITDFGWHVVKRVPPPAADPLESADILARSPVTQSARVKHILLGWKEVHPEGDDRGAARSRADLEKLVKATVAKLRAGAKIDPLMKQLSEDPGSAQNGSVYPVTPDAGLIEPFKELSLRLRVGEIGVVKSQFGIHIIQRVE